VVCKKRATPPDGPKCSCPFGWRRLLACTALLLSRRSLRICFLVAPCGQGASTVSAFFTRLNCGCRNMRPVINSSTAANGEQITEPVRIRPRTVQRSTRPVVAHKARGMTNLADQRVRYRRPGFYQRRTSVVATSVVGRRIPMRRPGPCGCALYRRCPVPFRCSRGRAERRWRRAEEATSRCDVIGVIRVILSSAGCRPPRLLIMVWVLRRVDRRR
jgi:hypothetical protein